MECRGWSGGWVDVEVGWVVERWIWKWRTGGSGGGSGEGSIVFGRCGGMEGRRAGGSGVDGGVEWEVDEDEEVTRLSAIFRRFSDSIHSC